MKKYRLTKERKELLKKVGITIIFVTVLSLLSSVECYYDTGVVTGLLHLFM